MSLVSVDQIMNYLEVNAYHLGWLNGDRYVYFYDSEQMKWSSRRLAKVQLFEYFEETFPIFDIGDYIVNSVFEVWVRQ